MHHAELHCLTKKREIKCSSDSSEFEESCQIRKVDGYNVHDDTNLISSTKTTPKRLICYSSTCDNESSAHLRPHIPIDENSVQFPQNLHIILRSFIAAPKFNLFTFSRSTCAE
ncbi:hypothetical protein AVEN_180806-1, partial [Araneus ventricosus]